MYILSFILLISCNQDDNENCLDYETAYVTPANTSPSDVINQNITIEVLFGVINGCGGFNNFIDIDNGNNKIIEVETKYEGFICTQAAEIISMYYIFNTQTTGDYEFKSSETEFIIVNVTI